MLDDERWHTCLHESAHSIVGQLLGYETAGAVAADVCGLSFVFTKTETVEEILDALTINLSGVLAEKKAGGPGRPEGDTAKISELLDGKDYDKQFCETLINMGANRAKQLVHRHWARIRRLAKTMYKDGGVSSDDIRKVADAPQKQYLLMIGG